MPMFAPAAKTWGRSGPAISFAPADRKTGADRNLGRCRLGNSFLSETRLPHGFHDRKRLAPQTILEYSGTTDRNLCCPGRREVARVKRRGVMQPGAWEDSRPRRERADRALW